VPAPEAVNEAFRHLQSGDPARALECARQAVAGHPTIARARLAEGIALRMLGRLDEAEGALTRAAKIDGADAAVAYERGVVQQLRGALDAALAHFERARELNPGFFAAQFSAGSLRLDRRDWQGAAERFRAALAVQPGQADALQHLTRALLRLGRGDEADEIFVHALAADPHDFQVLRAFGRHSVARGNFKRAAKLFAEAFRARPDDAALPIFIAQVELLQGNWDAAWAAYAHRETRRHLERTLAERGAAYRHAQPASLRGRDVCLVAEQGYGDILFFLRWAPRLARAGARLHFIGPQALHGMLARTGLFETLHAFGDARAPAAVPLLVGDLPQLFGGDPLGEPALPLQALPERLAAWRSRLEQTGPRPWIGATWRAGLPHEELAHGLHKSVPVDALFTALRELGGTVIALQRRPAAGEIEAAGRARGAAVHDFAGAHDDLEDALALVTLLDRHVGVSNTNMHLAASAGRGADVLVPFPPEWRWRASGDSPWFPGFRVHRQEPGGDWSRALARIPR
jgi:tetratricopeptide (TPR) repeat protein